MKSKKENTRNIIKFLFEKQHTVEDELGKNVLAYIWGYVSSFDWIKKEESQYRMRRLLETQFDYGEVAKELGVTDVTLRNFVKYYCRELRKYIGETTVSYIVAENYKDAMISFEALRGTLRLTELLVEEFVVQLPPAYLHVFSLEEMQQELEVMRKYSKVNMQEDLSVVDIEKLGFIRYVMETDTPKYMEIRKEIYSRLT